MPHEGANRDRSFSRHRAALCDTGFPGWLQDCAGHFNDDSIGRNDKYQPTDCTTDVINLEQQRIDFFI